MIFTINNNEELNIENVGGKGKTLIETIKSGFPVPEFSILTVDFFKPWLELLNKSTIWESYITDPQKDTCDKLKLEVNNLSFTVEQNSYLNEAMGVFKSDQLFAIRSSSPEEDIDDASFAGMYDTLLGITQDNIESGIKEIFSSAFDFRVVEYKKKIGMSYTNPRIAIVVQRQISSEKSGVAFSINPINNCYDEAFINASYGLGETIVSGLVRPDTYIVDKVKDEILDIKINEKKVAQIINSNGNLEQIEPENSKESTLDNNQIFQVTNIVSKCEKYYKKPMDIEWAIEGGKLYLLQSRPITTHIEFYPEMITRPGEPKRLYLDFIILTQGINDSFSTMGMDLWTQIVNMSNKGTYPVGKDAMQYMINGRDYLVLSNMVRSLGINYLRPIKAAEKPLEAMLNDIDFKKEFWSERKNKAMKPVVKNYIKMIFNVIPSVIGAILNLRKAGENYRKLSDEVYKFITEEI